MEFYWFHKLIFFIVYGTYYLQKGKNSSRLKIPFVGDDANTKRDTIYEMNSGFYIDYKQSREYLHEGASWFSKGISSQGFNLSDANRGDGKKQLF